jgi:hypothetical protein
MNVTDHDFQESCMNPSRCAQCGEVARVHTRQRDHRNLRKALAELIASVREFEDALDAWTQDPVLTKLAKLANALTMANDRALYFGLGMDFRKDRVGGKRADRKRIMQFVRRNSSQ